MSRLSATVAATCLLAACSSSQLAGPDAALTVDLRIDAGHIHAFETDVTYNVLVTSGSAVISDYASLVVEYALSGTDTWSRVPLVGQPGGSFTGTHQFISAGQFHIRVVGKRVSQSTETVLYNAGTPITVIRPHFDAGGYRVEFELSPALPPLKAGTPYAIRFLVMQPAADASGVRAPVTGLAGVTLRCTNADGTEESHEAAEAAGGAYWTTHIFPAAGGVRALVQFPGTSGPVTVTMPFSIVS